MDKFTINHKEFETSLFTLSFPDDMEREYQDVYFKKSLRHNRTALLLAIFFFSMFGVLDAWLVPTVKEKLWVIRYAIFFPFTFGVFLFSFSPNFKRYVHVSLAAVVLLAGLGVNAMILLAPLQEIHSYYAGLILILFYGYAFIKIRFVWVTLACWIIVVSYEIVAIWLTQTPIPILINNNFFFLTANIFGMFAAYSIELYSRKDFAQSQLLKSERKKVEAANRGLEKRVAEGTKQIKRANKELRQEIEGRKGAEVGLRESEAKYRSIIENIEEGYFEVDLKGDMTFLNASLCKISGYTRDELLGMNNRIYTTPASSKKMYRVFNEIFEEGKPGKITDYEVIKKDGTIGVFELSASLLRDRSSNSTGFRGIVRDITERKWAEEELKRSKESAETANRAKSEFLANMSHELRTPLNHIIGFTEVVVDGHFGELNRQQKEYLGDSLASSHHLLSLINDILDLSKVEAGKVELEPSTVDLDMLLENSLIMVKEKALKHGINLSSKINGVPETIEADERKLKQIMYNLISNAVKFTPNGGGVSVTAQSCNSSEVKISVSDTGIGICPEDLERIFHPFEQVEVSKSRKYQGTGLGLSLTKKLVELHRGKIWVESEGEGKGATFNFTIPINRKEHFT